MNLHSSGSSGIQKGSSFFSHQEPQALILWVDSINYKVEKHQEKFDTFEEIEYTSTYVGWFSSLLAGVSVLHRPNLYYN